METIGNRIEKKMAEKGITQPELARLIGVSQGAISQQINLPNRKSKYLPEIATALGVTYAYLVTGKDDSDVYATRTQSNVVEAREPFPSVPLISSVVAGKMKDIDYVPDPHDLEDAPRVAPTKKVGLRSWALEVEGYSMHDGTDRGIGPGWRLICDPDKAYGPGSFVIAKNVDDQAATFKQLVFEDNVWILRPLNRDPAYKSVTLSDPSTRVIAVVTEAIPPSLFLG
jgi:SOS-response transcriptional repressor LexA